ncbi:MAG: hypothetical protein Q9M21_07855, partial [Mariprofundaceae bacterium]|nr:hypothetical protein [Mariprofundaceae bacterium]
EVLRTYEGYARFQLDQFGLNNDTLAEILPEKRVFVVGDSFVEAYQVMRKENFVSRLGNQWHDSLLFNAGISGVAPDESWVIYDALKNAMQPTHILLCVNASDLYELLTAKEERDAQGALKALIRPVDKPSYFTSLKLWIYGHSALITHLKWKYENDIRAWFSGHDEKTIARKSHNLIGEKLSRAIERWVFVLHQFQQQGVKLTVLMMPELKYLPHKSVQQKVRQGRTVLMEHAKAMGVPVLDSNPVLADDFGQTGVPAIGFANTHFGKGHINVYGHKILANWLGSQRDIILR